MDSTVSKDGLLSNQEISLYYTIFQNSMTGQILVDDKLRIISINNRMLQYFQNTTSDVIGLSFGHAFHCAKLKTGQMICGLNKKCLSCDIWRAMKAILEEDASIKDKAVQYTFYNNKYFVNKWFLINGTQIIYENRLYAEIGFTDITELKRQEGQLKEKLKLDLATGAMNKYSLIEAIQDLLERSSENCNFTVCMVDFDNFKEVNDLYGHLIGDNVLEVFINIAQKHMRKKDILGRFGGEEFVFVFYDADELLSLQLLKRIHKELFVYFFDVLKIPITFSAGIDYVDRKARSLQNCSELISNVDKMLYQAKKSGKSRAKSNAGEVLFDNIHY